MNLPLTAEQAVAATHSVGPCIVCSVAGSGKTHTVCELCRHWVTDCDVPPGSILVATFSTSAAADFKRRAARAGLPRSIEMRTLNSVGWSIVGELSTKRSPVLVDPRSQVGWWVKKLVKDVLRGWHKRYADTPDADRVPKIQLIFGEIGKAKAYLIWPEEWRAADGRVFDGYVTWATTREREPIDEFSALIVADVYARWEAVAAAPESAGFENPSDFKPPRPLRGESSRSKKSTVRWFSYADQLAWPARWILEGRKFMEAYRGFYSRVVVDEAQDSNMPQNTVAEHLAHAPGGPNLVLVGDDSQAIYSFNGAQPELLRSFIDKFGARVLQLSANFRSAQIVLDAGQAILDMAENRLFEGDLVLGRTDDCAHTGTLCMDVYDDDIHEAEVVVDNIAESITTGESPDDIAILVRTRAQTAPFEVEFIKRGIRYQVAGISFFERAEIRAVCAYLKLALNGDDVDAFKRAMRTPNRGLGKKFFDVHSTLTSARSAYDHNKRALFSRWRDGLAEVIPHVDRVAAFLGNGSLTQAIQYVAEDVGVRKHLRDDKASEEDETDVDANIAALVDCAAVVGDVRLLLSYADDVDLAKSNTTGERPPEPRVTIATIHASKGLEWRVCYLPGWRQGTLPHSRALLVEETRLAYVAITRAAQHAYISYGAETPFGKRADPSVFYEAVQSAIEAKGLHVG